MKHAKYVKLGVLIVVTIAILLWGLSYLKGNDIFKKNDSYFVIYDNESGSTEFIPNPNKDNVEGAGPASVQLIASRGVKKVVSGEFGAKVKAIFDQLQIQLIIIKEADKPINEIIDLLNHEK